MDREIITRIGSDECLKGDTFGGLVVAAVKAGPEEREKLAAIGVRDSKTISNKKIHLLSKEINKILGADNICVVEILPEEYNKVKSLTFLLNVMHKKATNSLFPADEIVVDQYPGFSVEGARSETKAESKYIEVAAASVIARASGLKQLDELSSSAGFPLPLGSTHVMEALTELGNRQHELSPEKFVKMDFRNVRAFFGRN